MDFGKIFLIQARDKLETTFKRFLGKPLNIMLPELNGRYL